MVYYRNNIWCHYKVCKVQVSWFYTSPISVAARRCVQYWYNGWLRHLPLLPLKGVYSTAIMIQYVTYLCHHKKDCTVLVSWFTTALTSVTTMKCVEYRCHGVLPQLSLSPLDGVYSTGVMVGIVTYLCHDLKVCGGPGGVFHNFTNLCQHLKDCTVLHHLILSQLRRVYSTGFTVYYVTYLCHHIKVCTALVGWFPMYLFFVTTKRIVQYKYHGSLQHLTLSQLKCVYSSSVMVYYRTNLCHHYEVC